MEERPGALTAKGEGPMPEQHIAHPPFGERSSSNADGEDASAYD